MKAAVYVRISRDKAGEGLGVERQEADCRALAARLGWEVSHVFCDNDLSAYSGKARPDYLRLLQGMRDGTVTRVLAWHTDRLHRSQVELEEFADVAIAQNVLTHTVEAGSLDLSTPSGLMVARILGATARYESDHKAARLRAKHAELRHAGKMVGQRTFGWRKDDHGRLTGELDPVESALVRGAVREVLAGGSTFRIAQRWNEAGHRTTRGGEWTHSNLRILLKNPKIAGLRAHKGAVVRREDGSPVVGQWQAIVTVEDWERVGALLADKRSGRSGAVRHLLGGIVRDDAGHAMYGAVARGVKWYQCATHGCRTSIRAQDVEPLAVAAVASAVLFGAPEHSQPAEGAEKGPSERLREISEERGRLTAGVRAGVLTLDDITPHIRQLDEEAAQVRESLDAALLAGAQGDVFAALRASLFGGGAPSFTDAAEVREKVKAEFLALPLDRQRALIRGALSVEVRKGRGTDRVTVLNHLLED